MMPRLARVALSSAVVLLTAVATTGVATTGAQAQDEERWQRRPVRADLQQARYERTPRLAVVGLREQMIRIYDGSGAQMLESSVSSGTTGYETPAGIFSVVQKNEQHYSNLYDDASMPFMQRLTWTGIALHAGELPGYAASHGCVRLPYSFAEQLFDATNIGMRVVVAREGIVPVATAEPSFFRRGDGSAMSGAPSEQAVRVASADASGGPALRDMPLSALEVRADQLAADAEDAGRQARELRNAAAKVKAAVQPAERALRNAQSAVTKAEADLAAAEKLLAAGTGPKKKLEAAEKVKAEAPARIEAARAALVKVEQDADTKLAAQREAEVKAEAATLAHVKAREAADRAKHNLSPVSVLVSRATQRIYVRKAFFPVWEGPVHIRDADKPLGSFVFTANAPTEATSRELRWSVVSLYKNPTDIEPAAPKPKSGKKGTRQEWAVTDAAAAEAALARLDVPADTAARISEIVLPGSSLIITDEAPSIETGKDTDFVIVMSGEPQGALTIRKREPTPQRDDNDYDYYWGGGSWNGSSRTPPRRRSPPSSGGFFWFN